MIMASVRALFAPPAPPALASARARPAVAAALRIETARLTLRIPGPEDFEAFAAFFASPRAAFVGGPIGRETAWRVLGTMIGHWSLRGWGPFAIVPKGDGSAIGSTGPWFPEGWPEPELGWMLWDATHEGQGLTFEAAKAARAHAYRHLGWTTAVSYIAPDNARSIALATRLGARPDPNAQKHDGDAHIVYRHPGPEDCA
jgi:RimJ/RimL family protein N-acetyltransferase